MNIKTSVLIFSLLLTAVLAGCSTNQTADSITGGENAPNAAPDPVAEPEPRVNTQLFDSAIRAAMDFKPSKSNSAETVPLANELRLIKPAVKSKADQDLFAILEKLALVQKDRQLLIVAVESFRTAWGGLLTSSKNSLAEMEELKRQNPGLFKSNEEAQQHYRTTKNSYDMAVLGEKILSKGGVILTISSGTASDQRLNEYMKKSGVIEVAEKYNIPISTDKGFTFFPAKELINILSALDTTLTDSANAMRFE